jgi:hypothetical protein
MSHTPSPWHIGRRLRATIEGEEYATLFESVEIPAVAGGGIALVPAHHKADSLLIAAAPDLLEALTDLVNDFDRSVWTKDPMLIKARAAIAKAEGREGE